MPKNRNSEVDKLKAENARLKAEVNRLSKSTATSPPHKPFIFSRIMRNGGVFFLVVLAALLLAAANIFFWAGNTIVKQDRFVAATSPIIKDPAVQQTIALYTTNNIFKNIDVQKNLEEVLPPRADFLAPQLTSQLKNFTNSSLQKVLAKPAFQEKWNNVMARQHQRLIDFAASYKGDDTISINDIYNQLAASLSDTKLAFLSQKKLPDKLGSITVISAPWLPKFHNVVTHIDQWRLFTALALVLFIALALWLSHNKRRTLYWFSALSALLMLITLVVLHAVRDRVVGKADAQYQDGVRHVIQLVGHSLVLQTVTILAAAILIALIAWISGVSRSAYAVKKQVNLIFSGKLHQSIFGGSSNSLIQWLQIHKRQSEWAIVGILAAIMLLVRLTLKSLVVYVIVLALLILLVEVIAGQPAPVKTRR